MNPASTARTPIDVAVGVLIRADGKFLITSRPEGKPYAGYWEFPGGKLEAGETVEQALQRELDEELGIHIHLNRVERWKELVMEYPHAVGLNAKAWNDMGSTLDGVFCWSLRLLRSLVALRRIFVV